MNGFNVLDLYLHQLKHDVKATQDRHVNSWHADVYPSSICCTLALSGESMQCLALHTEVTSPVNTIHHCPLVAMEGMIIIS
jgi:hypothetical protein